MSNDGDFEKFDANWKQRSEARYNHWTDGAPQNQIQFAFRMHWKLFQNILKHKTSDNRKVLEVGCGRGSISSYFAAAKYDTTCLDASSAVLNVASDIFKANELEATFIKGDANNLDFKDNEFDVVVSIGLLEHFDNPQKSLSEMSRVLKKDGILLAYIVPEKTSLVQEEYDWINGLLQAYVPTEKVSKGLDEKEDIFRTSYDSKYYLEIIKDLPLVDVNSSGIYSVPMISSSTAFPFTLLSPQAEKILVEHFGKIIAKRQKVMKEPWLCDEEFGQAFLIWGKKAE